MLLSFLSHEPYIAQWGWMTNSEIENEILVDWSMKYYFG